MRPAGRANVNEAQSLSQSASGDVLGCMCTTLTSHSPLRSTGSVAAPCASAEDKIADVTDMQALRAAVRADKKAFVASTLKLTVTEEKRFWPIYDEYQRNLDMTNRRRVVAIQQLAVGGAAAGARAAR